MTVSYLGPARDYQEDEPDPRPIPPSLQALNDLFADVATAMSALYEIRNTGELLHESWDDVDSYVDQAARVVVLELKGALGRWGERVTAIEGATQTMFYSLELNEQGIYGNCLQAAIASYLGKPLEAVPHFAQFDHWFEALQLYLSEFIVTPVKVPPSGERCLLLGNSPRGVQHVVLGYGDQVIWDPHPSRAGLTEITSAIRLVRRSE